MEWAARCIAEVEPEGKPLLRIAGVTGPRARAVEEAQIAAKLGYHAALVGTPGWEATDTSARIESLKAVAEVLPVILDVRRPDPILDFEFWQDVMWIPSLAAIRIATPDRYVTLDIARALAESGRRKRIQLYTGNEDRFVSDLLTPFRFGQDGEVIQFMGGMLHHWRIWTRRAVELMDRISAQRERKFSVPADLLMLGQQIADMQAAVSDARHGCAGQTAGLREILRRQGLLQGPVADDLSPGHCAEIDRVCAAYPHLTDDDFVREHRDSWLS